MVLEIAGGHGRNPNGIFGLLCREHFPGLVEYDGVTSPAYTFDHYAVAPDMVSRIPLCHTDTFLKVLRLVHFCLSSTATPLPSANRRHR